MVVRDRRSRTRDRSRATNFMVADRRFSRRHRPSSAFETFEEAGLRMLLKGIAVVCFAVSVCGQGTIQFVGFEEYPVGAAPPFVTQIWRANPVVLDNTSAIKPFE